MENKITGYTKLMGIIASPIKHSLSPSLHNSAFNRLNLDYVYLAFEVEKDNLQTAFEGLKAIGIEGLNISMPYKQAIIPLLDGLDESAKLCEAVNTIVKKDDQYIGYCTDGSGFMASLKDENIDVLNKKIVILGTGGAATAILVQAVLDGVKDIVVYKRNMATSDFIHKIEQLRPLCIGTIEFKDLSDLEALKKDLKNSALLVQATSVGMKPYENDCLIPNESYLHQNLAVVDIIYNPLETKLLQMAKVVGCKSINGKSMLLFQGAKAFELWTNHKMDIAYAKKTVMGME